GGGRRHADSGAAGRRLWLPVPWWPVRPGRQSHRRATCPAARSLRVLHPQRPARPWQDLQRGRGDRRRSQREDQEVPAGRAGAARGRAGAGVLPATASKLMAAKGKSGKSPAMQAALYPVDWLEERSGLIGGLKYFLFRNVPRDSGWWHTLGSATLTAFLVQLGTGVILAMYYKPDPNSAYESVQHINNDVTLGWLVRGMHRWGASVFIILIFFHMARVFLFGAYKYPRELNWIVGVLLLPLALLEGFSGYLLPYAQTAYWATVGAIN